MLFVCPQKFLEQMKKQNLCALCASNEGIEWVVNNYLMSAIEFREKEVFSWKKNS